MQPEPTIPDAAGMPAAVTLEERAALAAFLTWAADFGDWARSLKARAAQTKAWCDPRG